MSVRYGMLCSESIPFYRLDEDTEFVEANFIWQFPHSNFSFRCSDQSTGMHCLGSLPMESLKRLLANKKFV